MNNDVRKSKNNRKRELKLQFCEKLSAIMRDRHLTQVSLAQKMKDIDGGSYKSSIEKWCSEGHEDHSAMPAAYAASVLAAALDCDIDYLFSDQKEYRKSIQTAADEIGFSYDDICLLGKLKRNAKYALRVLLNDTTERDIIANLLFESFFSAAYRAINERAIDLTYFTNSDRKPPLSLEDYTHSEYYTIMRNMEDHIEKSGSLHSASRVILDSLLKNTESFSEFGNELRSAAALNVPKEMFS